MENNYNFSDFIPGTIVECPSQPDWGLGQVQSCINSKITINFENVGKKVIDLNGVDLKTVSYTHLTLPTNRCV